MHGARLRARLRSFGRCTLGTADDRVGNLLANGIAGQLERPQEKVDIPIAAVAAGARAGDSIGEECAFASFADTWGAGTLG